MDAALAVDPKESDQVLNAAMRTHAQIILESAAFPNTTINGYLVSGDDNTVLLEVSGHLPAPVERLIDTRCEARLYCEQRYCFSTSITGAPRWGKSRALAISRPHAVTVLDRRRFLRAKLAPSSKVELQWTHRGEARTHTASLLNISADGLACKAESAATASLERDSRVQAGFELPHQPQPFTLEAAVMNRTPASEGHMIIGLQFLREPEAADELNRLRQAFGPPAPTKARTKACV
jgi:hypothetical protein